MRLIVKYFHQSTKIAEQAGQNVSIKVKSPAKQIKFYTKFLQKFTFYKLIFHLAGKHFE